MLLTLVIGSVLLTMNSAVGLNYHKFVYAIALAIVASIPLISVLLLALTHVKTNLKASQCFGRSKIFLLEKMNQNLLKEEEVEERPALLNPCASSYNTFP